MRSAMMVGGAMLFAGMLGCEVQPCDRYVNYICDCHADDPDFDCNEISQSLANADPSAQDQCSIDLSDLQDEDQAAGIECSTEEPAQARSSR